MILLLPKSSLISDSVDYKFQNSGKQSCHGSALNSSVYHIPKQTKKQKQTIQYLPHSFTVPLSIKAGMFAVPELCQTLPTNETHPLFPVEQKQNKQAL